MRTFHPSTINGKAVSSRRMTGCGYGSFLLGDTLGGLQEIDGQPSALASSGNGLGMGMMPSSILTRPMMPTVMSKSDGMGMYRTTVMKPSVMPKSSGMGLSSINKKLESLMVKASKPKPKNIKFNM